jgi:hypothetical protein
MMEPSFSALIKWRAARITSVFVSEDTIAGSKACYPEWKCITGAAPDGNGGYKDGKEHLGTELTDVWDGPFLDPEVTCTTITTPNPTPNPTPNQTPNPNIDLISPVPFIFNEEPECPADVKFIGSVGETSFDNFPITIVSQDTSTVTFEVKGSWPAEIAYLYARYHNAEEGQTEKCFAYQTVDGTFSTQITAECMSHTPISIVNIFISDSSLDVETDIAEVPECCEAPEQDTFPVVEYSFKIYCVPQCPDDVVSKREEVETRKLPEANEGSKLRGTAIRSAAENDRN